MTDSQRRRYRMRMLALTLLILAAMGCGTSEPAEPEGAAGAPAHEVERANDAEQHIMVGVAQQALTACYAAKSKVKARYGCVSGWTETATEIRNTGGTCPWSRDYLIFKTVNQPPATEAANFEVDIRDHRIGGGWRFSHYVQCSCSNAPCVVISQP